MPEQASTEWYVVRTKPHQENTVESSLTRIGIEVLFPRIKEQRVIRRKRQQVVSSLFPGYVFAKCQSFRLRGVHYAKGVREVVSFGAGPVVIREEIVHEISQRLDGGIVVLRSPTFSRGDVVRIQEGPLCGLEAIFEREMVGQQRAVLLMKMLDCQMRVVLDVKSLVNC